MKKISITLSIVILLMNNASIASIGRGVSPPGVLIGQPPGPPLLLSPINEATLQPDTVTMIWLPQPYTASYNLEISKLPDFSSLVINKTELVDTTISLSTLEENTIYYWRVSASNVAGEGQFSEIRRFATSQPSSVYQNNRTIPKNFALLPAYPNPFNSTTTIIYHIPKETDVSLVVFNSLGQVIRELVNGQRQAGEYKVLWHGCNDYGTPVTSGLYICQFRSGGHVFIKKILLMR